jgi:hypothetical protein
MTGLLKAQSFEYIYATPSHEFPYDVIEDDSGNFVIVGYSGVFGLGFSGDFLSLAIKINRTGDTIKTVTLPKENTFNLISDIELLGDSAYIVFFAKQTINSTDVQLGSAIIDTGLNIINNSVFGSNFFSERPIKVKKAFNGGYYLIGFAENHIDNNYQIPLYYLSDDGDSLNSVYLGDSTISEFGFDLLELKDTSGLLLFTYGWSSPIIYTHTEILALNNNWGLDTVVLMDRTFFTLSAEWLSDSIFIVASQGFHPNDPSFYHEEFRLKLFDKSLTELRDTLFGTEDTIDEEAHKMVSFIDTSRIYVGGTGNSKNLPFHSNFSYYYVTMLNSQLEPYWEKYFKRNDDYLRLSCVLATKDGGVLLAGTTFNDSINGPNEADIYILKLDSSGNFTVGTGSADLQQHEVLIFPNPVQETLTIKAAIQLGNAEFV